MMGEEQNCENCGAYLEFNNEYHIDCDLCGTRNINQIYLQEEDEDGYTPYDLHMMNLAEIEAEREADQFMSRRYYI